MDPLLRLTIRLVQWLRQPPSRAHVVTMLVVLGAAVAIVTIERVFGWPAWLTVDPAPRVIR
jgi:hypothetical protein